jgi:hypothetical protein
MGKVARCERSRYELVTTLVTVTTRCRSDKIVSLSLNLLAGLLTRPQRRKVEQESSTAKTGSGTQTAAADSEASPAAFQPRPIFWVLVLALAALVAVAGTLFMLRLYNLGE